MASDRKLTRFDNERSKNPLQYDAGALSTLRPDQIPRFLGALTHPDRLETKEFSFDELVTFQNRVDTARVTEISKEECDGEPCGIVARFNGKNYLLDGNHRVAGRWLAGDETVKVSYVNLQPISNAMKAEERVSAKVCKVDETLGLVFGWGMICKVDGEDYYDLGDDHFPEEVMLKAATEYMLEGHRTAADMHVWDENDEPVKTGEIVFMFPLTEQIAKSMDVASNVSGLMIAMKPQDPAILAKYRSGEYTGFSVGGQGVREQIDG